MRQSKLFTKTRKEGPADEVSKNAELLVRGGFIHKELAGVYSYFPLGLRVLSKIRNIIREEMNALGGQEIYLSTLQDKSLWQKTDRWDDEKIDVWFKTKLRNGTELGLGFTHEEPLTTIMKSFISSYRDLPKYVYQFQDKFRNEERAKSGILRGREFLMKDLYSFCKDSAEHDEFYDKSKEAYKNIFDRVGIGHLTYLTFASGGAFSKYSHEFQTISDVGEDMIYVDEGKQIAVNKEVYNDEVLERLGLNKNNLIEKKSIEVGNIFSLGTKFSLPLGLSYKTENGEEQPVVMGSYGIGLPRLMGTVVEVLSDERGIVWPESIAPFRVHLIEISNEKLEIRKEAEQLYDSLQKKGVEVLYDDRSDSTPGEKFADADLIGIPYRVVVSERSLEKGGVEVKGRTEKEGRIISMDEFIKEISGNV